MTGGGPKYAAFVEQELKAERDRRASIEARAQLFVTASGGIVAALAAVGAFISSRKDYALPVAAQYPLIVSVTMFTITLMLAIAATYNFAYAVASRDTLLQLPRNHWNDTEDVAVRNITATNVSTVLTLRNGNDKKVIILFWALIAQLIALAGLGATIYIMVISV